MQQLLLRKKQEQRMFIKRLLVLMLLVLGLAGCSRYDQYQYLLSHPEKLQDDLARCNMHELPATSETCQNAWLVKQVSDQYFALQSAEGERYYKAQQQYLALANKLKTITNEQRRQALLAQQRANMLGDEQVFLAVQENFAKLIMAQESKLAALKTKQLALQQQLRASQGSVKALKIQLNMTEQQIVKTQQMIQAMLALVGLNEG